MLHAKINNGIKANERYKQQRLPHILFWKMYLNMVSKTCIMKQL